MNKHQLLLICKEQKAKQRERAQTIAYSNLLTARQNSDFKNIEKREKELTFEIGKLTAFNQPTDKQKQELKKVQKQKEEILKNLNLTSLELTPKYVCKKCEDTGYTANGICGCLKKMLNEMIIKQSGATNHVLCDFKDINFDLASTEEHKLILKKLEKKFIEISNNFPNNTPKIILMCGNTGVGKTFLAGCLAKSLMEKDFVVSFISSFSMNNLFLSYHTTFNEEKQGYLDALLDPDVLVIDDLGTEPTLKNITLEYLYLIITERSINNKLTIITTNLGIKEIQNKYNERIMSRLCNKRESFMVQIQGTDIRLNKENK